jgi:hypothetical protein
MAMCSSTEKVGAMLRLRKIGTGIALSGVLSLGALTPAFAVTDPLNLNFADFVSAMNKGDVQTVLFEGVTPSSCVATFKSGGIYLVKEGFPAYDDPRSGSGPTQVIGLCQHTPGVECKQDLSSLMLKSRTSKTYSGIKPMPTHSSYPAASEFSRLKVNYTPNDLDP